MLCKQEKHDEIFGAFDKMLKNNRDSDQIRLTQCRADAGNNLYRQQECMNSYTKNIRETNEKMKTIFAQEYKNYM